MGILEIVTYSNVDIIFFCFQIVAPDAPGTPLSEDPDGIVPLGVVLQQPVGAVVRVGLHHNDLEGGLLDHQAVEEVAKALLLVADGHDDADEHGKCGRALPRIIISRTGVQA